MNLTAPLLWRQLALEAAQGRTFWIRPLFGLAVALALVLAAGNASTQLLAGEGLEVGAGRVLFDALVVAGFIAIYLGLPALVAPALAAEEERGTLDLLSIAGIGPLALILQLAGARLAMALTLALAALPLAALAYAGGGVSDQRLLAAFAALLAAALQVTACSAAAGARRLPATQATLAAYRDVVVHLGIVLPLACLLALILTAWFGFAFRGAPWTWYISLADGPDPAWQVALGVLPPMAAGIWWHLRQARRNLRRRSVELPPTQRFLMERWRPGMRWRKEARRIRIKFGFDRHELPDLDPVGWRARLYVPLAGSRLLMQRMRLLGCLLPILGLVVLFNTMAALSDHHGRMGGLLLAADLIYVVILVIAVYATAIVLPRERAAGTAEVLATTPLSGPEVASGFIGGAGLLLRRSWLAYIAVLAYAHLIEGRISGVIAGALGAAAALGWAGCAAWGGLLVGARWRSPLMAGTAAVAAVILACLVPWLAGRAALATGWGGLEPWFSALSPIWLAGELHQGDQESFALLIPGAIAALVWCALWALLRHRCRTRMDGWLGRTP